MTDTSVGTPINNEVISNYFEALVNRFFKILPIREAGESTLPLYIQSLQIEILGCKNFINTLENNSNFLTLLSILQYIHDNPDCPIKDVKREVFRSINICNRLKRQYMRTD